MAGIDLIKASPFGDLGRISLARPRSAKRSDLRITSKLAHQEAKEGRVSLARSLGFPQPEGFVGSRLGAALGSYDEVIHTFPSLELKCSDLLLGEPGSALASQRLLVCSVRYQSNDHLERIRHRTENLRAHGVVIFNPTLVVLLLALVNG